MSHIYLISPSGAVLDKAGLRRALARFKAMGHEVETDPEILTRHQRFAGDDATRLQAFARAAASGADAVMITRGGYGLTRVLPHLPYAAIDKSIKKGTRWMGFSDFTAFSLAMLSQRQVTTWAGPAMIESFGGEDDPHPITQACFEDWISGATEGTGWRIGKDDPTDFVHENLTLWGGNLAMVCALLGTPYMPQVSKGALFLEDVAEPAYRVERMLTQLALSGVLAQQKVIFLGHFSQMAKGPLDKGYGMQQVVQWLRAHTKAKVITGMPFGHVPGRVIVPVGGIVDVAVQDRECLVLWSHDHD